MNQIDYPEFADVCFHDCSQESPGAVVNEQSEAGNAQHAAA